MLGYRPGWQSLADLNEIARHVSDLDPTIRTFIVPTTMRNSVSRKQAARLPTLVFSPGEMRGFSPLRGKVYHGWPMPKAEEVRRLTIAGVPVPRTVLLTPGLELDRAVWGDFVIVKPTDLATSSYGRGIQLMRTERVRYIAPQDYASDHPGRLGPMMVQQFVDTGETITCYRVLTLFGEPLYFQFNEMADPRVDLNAADEVIERAPIANQSFTDKKRLLITEPDVLALARRAHEAIPEVPLKGVDILREIGTGKLYVIEVNCRGNTWHFSSAHMAATRKKEGAGVRARPPPPVRCHAHRCPRPGREDQRRGGISPAR